MSEEEIIKQYANGIVNADEVIKSLIDKFKTDKTSVDIQQSQLIAEYLLYKVDKLQKGNKYLQERLEFRIRCCNELEHELYEEGNYIHKEVIRKKIKELEEESNGDDYTLINVINILKNLIRGDNND